MCGIAAIVTLNGMSVDKLVLERMTSSLRHRGPDEGGTYISGPLGFGFRRLAILDLSIAARQPMVSDDGEVILVFNGEIYNYVELRRELLSLGHTFRSRGDTEVLLRAYLQWGMDCLTRLNGMWAFLIYDRHNNRIFGSRDRFGEKPLYYYRNRHCVLFASEIKAIRASGEYPSEINWTIAARFLLENRMNGVDESFYAGIEQVSPGSAFELDLLGRWRRWRYWSTDQIPSAEVKDPADSFAEIFEDSVRLRMRSDVPLGVCLSGGLDSTSIICAVARLRGPSEGRSDGPLAAFSYITKEYDESRYISATIEYTRARLYELQTSPLQLWEILGKVLWFQDEPIHSMNVLIGFELMRLAATTGIKVILNGQGSDEIAAGYFSYFTNYWEALIREGHWVDAWREIRNHAEAHKVSEWKLISNVIEKVLFGALHRVAPYRRFSHWRHTRQIRRNAWFTPELSRNLSASECQTTDRTLDAVLMKSVAYNPLPLYLRIEDRNSMAHSVEARLPFLDHRLVSLLFQLPAEWKLRGPWNKFVLREAMRRRIPECVRTRVDKMGFNTPESRWFADELHEPMMDILTSRDARESGIYNVEEILRDLERHRKGQIMASPRLFNIAQFQILTEMVKDGGVPDMIWKGMD